MQLLWDLESDGLLDEVSKVHCIVGIDLDKSVEHSFRSDVAGDIAAGVDMIREADVTVGHNVLNYDWAVLGKLFKVPRPERGTVLDTLHWARAAWPTIKFTDNQRDYFPAEKRAKLIGAYSLEAFGFRLKEYKGEYDGGWESFNEDMFQYCRQDVNLNAKLFWKLMRSDVPPEVAALETEVAYILDRQERHGVRFDVAAAQEFYAMLAGKREQLRSELSNLFEPWYRPDGRVTEPKRVTNRRPGTKLNPMSWPVQWGGPMQAIKLTQFNPGSSDHKADRLMKVRGWKPKKFGANGKPTCDADILARLRYPEVKDLLRFARLDKLIGTVAEGKGAWLKKEKNGRIHGRVNATGTGNVRMSHTNPNTGNVPKPGKPYGEECRLIWLPDDGDVLLGCDASGVQMRGLAHYLARWDGGAFGRVVCDPEGDVHTLFMKYTGITDRDIQKRFTYALTFNAQAGKLAQIMGKSRQVAAKARATLAKQIKLDKLDKALDKAHSRGYFVALDGRKVRVKSRHPALAMLLQAFEACVMKVALVVADSRLRDLGYVAKAENGGKGDYEFVLNVHDEWQVTVAPDKAPDIKFVLEAAIVDAGKLLNLRVPLAAEGQIGANWKETH